MTQPTDTTTPVPAKKNQWEPGNPFPDGCKELHNFPEQQPQKPIYNVPRTQVPK